MKLDLTNKLTNEKRIPELENQILQSELNFHELQYLAQSKYKLIHYDMHLKFNFNPLNKKISIFLQKASFI